MVVSYALALRPCTLAILTKMHLYGAFVSVPLNSWRLAVMKTPHVVAQWQSTSGCSSSFCFFLLALVVYDAFPEFETNPTRAARTRDAKNAFLSPSELCFQTDLRASPSAYCWP